MFENKYTLPRAELKMTFRDRNHFARTREDHSDVGSGIIRAFGRVHEVVGVFRHEAFEIFFEINPRGSISVLEDDETCAGMLEKNGGRAGADAAPLHHSFDGIVDFVCAFAFRRNDDRFGMCRHWHRLTMVIPRRKI